MQPAALRARQRLWQCQVPCFDIAAWVLDLAGLVPGMAFPDVTCVRPARAAPVIIEDASVAADYVSSLASHYQSQVTRPWRDVAQDVREHVQAVIDTKGEFRTVGDVAAFVCR